MKNIKKVIISGVVVAMLALALYLNRDVNYDITKFTYYQYFDTYIEVSIYEDVKDKDKLNEIVEARINEIYEMADGFNNHDVDGVYNLNNNGNASNKELASLMKYGISYYNDYSTQFNIALGPVIDIWKDALTDCNENMNCYVPSYEELKNSGNINSNDITIDGDEITIKPEMKIDLGAITKGYLADELKSLLEKEGYEHFIINAGGNIYASEKPNDEVFTVGVVNPIDNQSSFITLNIENKSIVTSGDYERYYEVDGVRYNHLINGETLFPSDYYHSVTIVSDKSIDGDILSTMLFGLEYEEGLEIVESIDGVDAVWYTTSGDIYKSSGIESYEKK